MIEKATTKQMQEFIGNMLFKGMWHVVHKDKWGKILSEDFFKNLLPDAAINYALDTTVHGGTAISAWYFAPFTNNYTPLAANTYAVPGYTEATTEYSEATRQEWGEGAAAAKSVTNATAATITASGAVTIYGAGIVGGGSAATTKGDAAGGGTLFASGLFTAAKTLATSETLDLTYTLTGASS